VDLESGRVIATAPVGKRPFRVVASPDGRTAYVASASEGTITVVGYAPPVAPKDEPPAPPPPAPEPEPEPVRPADPSATRWALAVADLDAQGLAASAAAIVTGWLRDELFKAGFYRVLERKAMDALLSEQALQQTGCTDSDCAVKLGKMLGVQRMLLGTMGKFDDVYVLNVRLVDVENGAVLWSDSAKGRTIDDVEGAVRRLARALSGAGK
jgi:DNA-binding beta-propeller fold protein YncE